jgi:hypothetical protein
VVTELVSIVSKNVTDMVVFHEIEVAESAGEVDKTVMFVVNPVGVVY